MQRKIKLRLRTTADLGFDVSNSTLLEPLQSNNGLPASASPNTSFIAEATLFEENAEALQINCRDRRNVRAKTAEYE